MNIDTFHEQLGRLFLDPDRNKEDRLEYDRICNEVQALTIQRTSDKEFRVEILVGGVWKPLETFRTRPEATEYVQRNNPACAYRVVMRTAQTQEEVQETFNAPVVQRPG